MISEAVGLYLIQKKKVTVSLGSDTIELWIGNPQAKVNGITKWIDDNEP